MLINWFRYVRNTGTFFLLIDNDRNSEEKNKEEGGASGIDFFFQHSSLCYSTIRAMQRCINSLIQNWFCSLH